MEALESDFFVAIQCFSVEEQDKISKAFSFAKEAHGDQKRKSGEWYFIHPISVALSLVPYKDFELVIAALLHDTVEDCPEVSMKNIYEMFGSWVGFLVDSVTKNQNQFYLCDDIEFTDSSRRFLWAGMQDVRCFLL